MNFLSYNYPINFLNYDLIESLRNKLQGRREILREAQKVAELEAYNSRLGIVSKVGDFILELSKRGMKEEIEVFRRAYDYLSEELKASQRE